MDSIVLVVMFAAYAKSGTALVGALLCGLLIDLWNGNPLGTSSAVLLFITFGVSLYKRKFNSRSFWFIAAMGIAARFVYGFIIEARNIFTSQFAVYAISTSLITTLVMLLVLHIYNNLWGEKEITV